MKQFAISEILTQIRITRIQYSSTAQLRDCDNMLIIRAALTRPIEFGHAAIDHFIGQTPEPPVLNRLPSPFHVSATPLQLLSQQATHNDTALFQCHPFRNIKCGEFRIFREHLADKIRINDQAHPQPPIDRCVSIMKNCR